MWGSVRPFCAELTSAQTELTSAQVVADGVRGNTAVASLATAERSNRARQHGTQVPQAPPCGRAEVTSVRAEGFGSCRGQFGSCRGHLGSGRGHFGVCRGHLGSGRGHFGTSGRFPSLPLHRLDAVNSTNAGRRPSRPPAVYRSDLCSFVRGAVARQRSLPHGQRLLRYKRRSLRYGRGHFGTGKGCLDSDAGCGSGTECRFGPGARVSRGKEVRRLARGAKRWLRFAQSSKLR